MARSLILAAVLAAVSGLSAESSAGGTSFDFLGAFALSSEEASAYVGGDVFMDLSESRTSLRIRIYDNEYEARLGRIGPKEDFTVPAHNRIVDSTEAPFMPKSAARVAEASALGLTSRPEPFPAGGAGITAVEERAGKYGPYMIKTNAVGTVDVYQGGVKIGREQDIGYAIHANSNDFSYSKSLGCVILRQADVQRLAYELMADKENYAAKRVESVFLDKKEPDRSKQVIRVKRRPEH